ncbi:hypothetical protein HYU06_02135 [Candidatus Woesearchaeota archaeon]|nr:hypothetical protein [Candidatus Woesearchaeota archaeon]
MNNKYVSVLIILLAVSLVVVSACAQNRGTGYATYGNTPPPRVTGSGGGCGVGAPADSGNDAAGKIAENIAKKNLF